MTRWLRRTLRHYGVELPFRAVICPLYQKCIEIDDAARVHVTVERTLVFLREPEPGDLRDVIPLPPDVEGDIHPSSDADELLRKTGPKGTTIYWTPREPVVPYGLYVHRYGWSSAGPPGEAALYTEFRCETPTGVARLEVKTPGTFETAVAFPWPPWRLRSVQTLVKYALRQLETSEGQRPEIVDNGSRLLWTIERPRRGERYACVAFHEDGVALWQHRIEASSLSARMRRLLRVVTPF